VIEGGGIVTTTVDLQEALRFCASTAEHASGVVPTANNEPDVGEQLEVTGDVPPTTVGANFTLTALPSETADGAGHVIVGGGA
jgi:hypothetical protein